MQNYCITYRCLNACRRTQMKVVWIKLWIFLHSKPVNKNNWSQNSMQHPIKLMVVWFETFHREITSLSAETYETLGADKVHWTLTLEVMTSSIKLIIWHTQTDAMPCHSTVHCSVNAISVLQTSVWFILVLGSLSVHVSVVSVLLLLCGS